MKFKVTVIATIETVYQVEATSKNHAEAKAILVHQEELADMCVQKINESCTDLVRIVEEIK